MEQVFKSLNLDGVGSIPAGVDVKNRKVSGWLSTVEMDRDGEVVSPDAFTKHLDVYKSNPVLLLHHMHKTLPVGKAINIEVRPEGLWGEYQIARTPVGDEVLQLLAEGCLRGFSAGFVPVDAEENPPIYKIPAAALKTSMGKKPKKFYKEVELVEVSLLAIPSNRSALVTQKEAGNHVAELVLKSFDIDKFEDLEVVIKEWVEDNKGRMEEEIKPLSGLLGEPRYTLKSLIWDESKHPRDKQGKFTDIFSDSVYAPIWEGKVTVTPDPVEDTKITITGGENPVDAQKKTNEILQTQSKKLDKIEKNTKDIKNELSQVNDKDSWSYWLKMWGTRAAILVTAFLAFKGFRKTPYYPKVKQRAKDWLYNKTIGAMTSHKGFNETSEIEPILEIEPIFETLDIMRDFLAKGRELGLEGTEDYKKAERLYNNVVGRLKAIAGSPGLKGLLDGIQTKGMTEEQFDESEHPRAKDGKFTRAVGAAAAVGTAAGVAYLGYKVSKNSAVWKRVGGNVEKAKEQIKNILGGSQISSENALSKHIINMEIVSEVEHKAMSPFQKELYSYLYKTENFQKDLCQTFGKIPGAKGPRRIEIYSQSSDTVMNAMSSAKDAKELGRIMQRSTTAYDPFDEIIRINLKQVEDVIDVSGFDKTQNAAKSLLTHEYAHSIFYNNNELKVKFLNEFEEAVKVLRGKKLSQKNPFFAMGEKNMGGEFWEFEVIGAKVVKEPAYGKKEIFGETFDQISEGIKNGYLSPERGDLLRKVDGYKTVITYKCLSKELMNLSEKTNAESMKMGKPSFIDKNGNIEMPLEDWLAKTGVANFDVVGMNRRDVYALANIDEYIAVKAERGFVFNG